MSPIALVVDDSMLIRHSVRRFLEDRGYMVETACNGLEALAVLDRVTPQLIITDLLMPKMSGAEFIREVRHRTSTAQVPVIVVAGRRGSNSSAPISGADFVVYKDIDLVEQLQLAIDKFSPLPAVNPDKRASKVGLN